MHVNRPFRGTRMSHTFPQVPPWLAAARPWACLALRCWTWPHRPSCGLPHGVRGETPIYGAPSMAMVPPPSWSTTHQGCGGFDKLKILTNCKIIFRNLLNHIDLIIPWYGEGYQFSRKPRLLGDTLPLFINEGFINPGLTLQLNGSGPLSCTKRRRRCTLDVRGAPRNMSGLGQFMMRFTVESMEFHGESMMNSLCHGA